MKFLNDITAFAAFEEDMVREELKRPSPFLPYLEVKVFTISDCLQNVSMSTEVGSKCVLNAINIINNSISNTIFYGGNQTLILDDTVYIIDSELDLRDSILLNNTLEYYAKVKREEFSRYERHEG